MWLNSLHHMHGEPWSSKNYPESKVHEANMGPTWVLSAPDGPNVGPMNLAIRVVYITASQHGNAFHITGLLWGESICHSWISLTNGKSSELWIIRSMSACTGCWMNSQIVDDSRHNDAHVTLLYSNIRMTGMIHSIPSSWRHEKKALKSI